MRLPILAISYLALVPLAAMPARADFSIIVESNTHMFGLPDTRDAAFNCSIVDGRSPDSKGELSTASPSDQWFVRTYREFHFDASTGLFTIPSQQTQWVIARHGNSHWDLIAFLPGDDPVFNILRIEVWNTPIIFTITDGTSFYSGTCVQVAS